MLASVRPIQIFLVLPYNVRSARPMSSCGFGGEACAQKVEFGNAETAGGVLQRPFRRRRISRLEYRQENQE